VPPAFDHAEVTTAVKGFHGHAPSIGLPPTPAEVRAAAEADVPIAEFGEVPVSA
jgi:hypothetical protein